MAQIDNRYAQAGSARTDVVVDEGLRAYMLRVYNYMAGGILLTGLVAYFVFTQAVTTDPALAAQAAGGGAYALKRGMYLTQFGMTIFASPLKWVVMLAPLAFVFFLSFRVYKMSLGAAQISFWLFAAVMGLSLSSIFLVFTGQSITQVFFVTAIAFGGLSLYGYTTKKDLSGWGSFLIMGVIGIIAAAPGQPVPAVVGPAVRHLGDRRAGVRWPYRLRHAADQGRLLRGDERRDAGG